MKSVEQLTTERTIARVGRQPSEPLVLGLLSGGAAYLVLVLYKVVTPGNFDPNGIGVLLTVGGVAAAGFLWAHFRRRTYRTVWNEERSRIRSDDPELR